MKLQHLVAKSNHLELLSNFQRHIDDSLLSNLLFSIKFSLVEVIGNNHCCYGVYLHILGIPVDLDSIQLIHWSIASVMQRNREIFEKYSLVENSFSVSTY